MRELATGTCEHCEQSFGYWLGHSGFGECSYACCDKCGMTAVLSYWDKRMPKLPPCFDAYHDTYCLVIENRVVNDNFKM